MQPYYWGRIYLNVEHLTTPQARPFCLWLCYITTLIIITFIEVDRPWFNFGWLFFATKLFNIIQLHKFEVINTSVARNFDWKGPEMEKKYDVILVTFFCDVIVMTSLKWRYNSFFNFWFCHNHFENPQFGQSLGAESLECILDVSRLNFSVKIWNLFLLVLCSVR